MELMNARAHLFMSAENEWFGKYLVTDIYQLCSITVKDVPYG
jgi:hypothetical protein